MSTRDFVTIIEAPKPEIFMHTLTVRSAAGSVAYEGSVDVVMSRDDAARNVFYRFVNKLDVDLFIAALQKARHEAWGEG